MPNSRRGEISALLDGTPLTLCLTLGALAELETAFGSDDMLSLASRFSSGRISAHDCVRIIGAGLRGAGHDITDDAVTRLRAEQGATSYVEIVARLLAATFGPPDATQESSPPMAKAHAAGEETPPRPFPGPR